MIEILNKITSPFKRRIKFYKNWSKVDFSELSHLVIFLGNPRSGTTLTRTIIDAHPNALIGNEVHILRYLQKGETWNQIIRRLCLNHDEFASNPIWTDYNYNIPGSKINKKKLKIVGDKRSVGTTKEFTNNPELLSQFIEWAPLPIKVIRCVRNPLDVIATKHWRNKKSLDWNIVRYFENEKKAEDLISAFKKNNTHYVYHEQLVQKPDYELMSLLSFLELDNQSNFIEACKDTINPTSNLSRWRANWNETQLKKAEELTKKLPHLENYLNNNKLVFGNKK